jgi:hypothetical protein
MTAHLEGARILDHPRFSASIEYAACESSQSSPLVGGTRPLPISCATR